jgi:hypothetical protein
MSRATKYDVILRLPFISLFQGSPYHQYWGEHLTDETTITGRLKVNNSTNTEEDKHSNLNTADYI